MRVVIVYCTREFCNLLRWNYDREVTTFSAETLISANHCCNIPIAQVIGDRRSGFGIVSAMAGYQQLSSKMQKPPSTGGDRIADFKKAQRGRITFSATSETSAIFSLWENP